MSPRIEHFAFSAEKVCSLTGLTRRQLSYWDSTDFFSPEIDGESGRVYSFRDLVALRTIAKLRETVPLQELRKIGKWLSDKHDAPWSSLRFYRAGRSVHFKDPSTSKIVAASPEGQTVCIEMEEIATETRSLIDKQRKRARSDVGTISKDRRVVRNSAVVSGTRIPVRAIWNFYNAGFSVAQIMREYPSLKRADVKAAIDYMAEKEARAAM